MKFIELFNFENASKEVNETLRQQLRPHSGNKVRWVEWTNAFNSMVPSPDVALIYAVDMNWISVRAQINKTQAQTVVLYGCIKPMLGLPTLRSIYDLDDMLNHMGPDGNMQTYVTTEPYPGTNLEAQNWKSTIPMGLPTTNQQ